MNFSQDEKHEKDMSDGSFRLLCDLWREHRDIMEHLDAKPILLEPGKIYKATLASQTPRQRMHDV